MSDLITVSIRLSESEEYIVNRLIEVNGKTYIIRSIKRIWYNPIRKGFYVICGVREFKGSFEEIPF